MQATETSISVSPQNGHVTERHRAYMAHPQAKIMYRLTCQPYPSFGFTGVLNLFFIADLTMPYVLYKYEVLPNSFRLKFVDGLRWFHSPSETFAGTHSGSLDGVQDPRGFAWLQI